MVSVENLRFTGEFSSKVEFYWWVEKLRFTGGFEVEKLIFHSYGLMHGGFSRKVVMVYMVSSVEKLWSTWWVE